MEKYGGVPPFAETQNYIQKVLSYAGETIDLSGIQTARSAGNSIYPSALDLLSALASGTGSSSSVFNQQDAQYLVELMRLRMESMFHTEVFSAEEESAESEAGVLI